MEIKNAIALAVAVLLTFAAVAALQEMFGENIANNRALYQKQLLHETLFNIDYDDIESFVPTVPIHLNNADDHAKYKSDNADLQNKLPANKPKTRMQKWWRVTKNNKTQAIVVQAATRGYGGDILFLLSFNQQAKQLRARIIRHQETPGIADFLSDQNGAAQAIDGVSGATITSNAMANSTRQIAQWIRYNKDILFSDVALAK